MLRRCSIAVPRRLVGKPSSRAYHTWLYNGAVGHLPHVRENYLVPETAAGRQMGAVTASRKAKYTETKQEEETQEIQENASSESKVEWNEASSADIVAMTEGEDALLATKAETKPGRPYVPLEEVAKIELRGDYCVEGGRFVDALQHYGIVAKAFKIAYPRYHNQQAHIALKLGRAFRLNDDYGSAEFNLNRALDILDGVSNAEVELMAETFFELGRTLEASGKPDAGVAYEDALAILNDFHNLGVSHRFLRLSQSACRHNHAGFQGKHQHFSIYDYDRTVAIVDAALEHAERFYRKEGDTASVVRVLEAHRQLLDRKYFNLRDSFGKIKRRRGMSFWLGSTRTNAPTPDELLRFSPTVHQPYRDYSLENTAPITFGEPAAVSTGSNRKEVDDGDPMRRITEAEVEEDRIWGKRPTYGDELLQW